jgi:predicted dehydrogenase
MTIRTIHVGAGGRGRWPLNRFRDRTDFEAVALVDVSAENLAVARETTGLGEEACFSALADALQAVDADAVVVITPPDLHAGQCLEAVRAGKHVLVEKPFTKDLSQARQIVAEAAERGLKVAVTQNARYYPPVLTIRRLLQSGELGHPSFGLMTKYGWRPRVHHSGADQHAYLWERGIHDFDQLRHLLDAEPRRLFCHSFNPPWSPYRGGGAIHGWIEFDDGTTFSFQCTFAAHKGGSILRLDCEKGSVEVVSGELVVRRPGADADETVPLDEGPEPEETLLDGFRDYVVDGVEPPFSGPRNLATVGLINALGDSSEQGAVLDFDDYMSTH